MHSTYNKHEHNVRLTNEIINSLYSFTQDPEKTDKSINKFSDSFLYLKNNKINYTKLISTLSKAYIDQYSKEFISNNKFKLFRLLEHDRQNWCLLKNKPLSKAITEPTAMDVEVAPYEELEPFFKFLDSNSVPIDNDWENEACMKFVRGALYQNKRLDLCKQVVGPDWIEILMNSLVNNTQIEHFLLGNNIIGTVGAKAIGKFLLNEHKPKIKTWYIAGNNINEEGIKWICEGLENDKDCVNLWLKRNPLKSEGIKHISKMLKKNAFIKILDLHNTAVLDEGLKYLVEGLKENRVLRHLYLDANGITEIGINYLVEYFEYLINNNLEGVSSLWLDMNKIEDDGAIKLIETLKNYKYLKRLVMGSVGLTEKSINSIVDSFSNHNNLIVLDLGLYKSTSVMGMITNNIGDEGMNILSKLIENNKSIKYLSIAMNGLTSKGIEILSNSLDKSDSLMYVDFSQYGIEIPQKFYSKIKSKVKSNRINANYNRSLRNLKHGENIHWIDSIYRNNMK
jgi:Ran GTPase-activating protein (RanGAP) involved in mRNA processing and transport